MSTTVIIDKIDLTKKIYSSYARYPLWGYRVEFSTPLVCGQALLMAVLSRYPHNLSDMIGQPIEISTGIGAISDPKPIPVEKKEIMNELALRYNYLVQGPCTDVLFTGEVIFEAQGFSFILPYIDIEKLPQDNQWLSFVLHEFQLWLVA